MLSLKQGRNQILAVAALAVVTIAVSVMNGGVVHAYQAPPNHPAGSFGAATVTVSAAQPGWAPSVIRAFVPTGSASEKCLVTFSESNIAWAGSTVYCGHRVYNGMDGLLLTVLLPADVPADGFIQLTLYQERALMYGSPMPYAGD